MKKWLRHQLWSICWEIGDTFMGWSFKFEDEDRSGWVAIDLHEHCSPKQPQPEIVDSSIPVTLSSGTSTTWVV
jgi:hypothetical protein